MSNSILINEDFQSYAPGNGIPTGFVADGVLFFPTFVDFSHGDVNGNNLENGAFFGNGTKGYFFNGTIKHIDTSGDICTSVFYEDAKTSDNPNVSLGNLAFTTVDLTNNIGPDLATVDYQADGTVVVNIAGGYTFFYPNQIFNFNRWSYKQINVTVGTQVSGGQTFITIQLDYSVNGQVLISTPVQITNQLISAGGGPIINCWKFRSIGLNGSYLDNITIYAGNTVVPNGTFPSPGIPNVRMSEGIVENIKLPSGAHVRMTQGAVEWIKLPTSANIRVTQMVIELIRGQTGSKGGAKVYEA